MHKKQSQVKNVVIYNNDEGLHLQMRKAPAEFNEPIYSFNELSSQSSSWL